MIDWKWDEQQVAAQEILDAANTLSMGSHWYEVDLIPEWTRADSYVSWAKECLEKNDAFGRDAAVCYAKRAVCRQIDALMTHNHLGSFLGKTYPEKVEMLNRVGLPIPGIVQSIIIDPRNEIEHKYISATPDQAQYAVELAEIFLRSLRAEEGRTAIISFAKSVDRRHEARSAPGNEWEHLEFSISRRHSPWLLIDVSGAKHRALIINPAEGTVLNCALERFGKDEAIELAKMLRAYYSLESFGKWLLKVEEARKLNNDLELG